jgi:hypothetical protein
VFTARYALSPYIKQTRFVFKGLIDKTARTTTPTVSFAFLRRAADGAFRRFRGTYCFHPQGDWIRRQHVPPKRRKIYLPHCVGTQKIYHQLIKLAFFTNALRDLNQCFVSRKLQTSLHFATKNSHLSNCETEFFFHSENIYTYFIRYTLCIIYNAMALPKQVQKTTQTVRRYG